MAHIPAFRAADLIVRSIKVALDRTIDGLSLRGRVTVVASGAVAVPKPIDGARERSTAVALRGIVDHLANRSDVRPEIGADAVAGGCGDDGRAD